MARAAVSMRRGAGLCAALGLSALLGACAGGPRPLYDWGDYQRQLYASLKQSSSPAEQLEVLQRQAEKTQARQLALPPGYRAQMGLLHLRLGSFDQAQALFEAEKAAFPEATPYMNFLLKRMHPAAATPAAATTLPRSTK